ncbi:DEAD/DEAH box helicase family protein [Pseudomonas sp. R9.37]|uniref:DEAD/DEAH box helicase family protein n=1 Tax=Pseudomonas sp. R9.37 TaxID=1390498 RepID=UPI000D0CBA51|nr:DEAD/DEAH box helicase family protein [Pseudomonas sp. R9.37]PSL95566.1 RNA helicase [Pseudomonas sp. R9.37]
MIPNKNKTIFVAEATPGTGKTEQFIKELDSDPYKRYVYAVPTKVLSKDVVKRIQAKGINHVCVINSDTHKNVTDTVECTLLEDDPKVLVITHKTLLDLDPCYLQDWIVVIDEVPSVANNLTKDIGDHAYTNFLEKFIEIDSVSTRAFIKQGMTKEARATYSDVVNDKGMSTICTCLGALLRGKADVFIKEYEDKKDSRWKWQIRVIDYFDLSGIYEAAQETHILGANVTGTLAYQHALTKGYKLEVSKFTPEHRSYKFPSYIYPLIGGSKVSKTMLLTLPNGDVAEEWNEQVYGHALLRDAIQFVQGEPILAQVHDWCKFPFEDYPNVIRMPFDARGLNGYSGVHHTLSLIHGNPNPVDDRNNSEMLAKMAVDISVGKQALRNERYREYIFQAATRSSIRTFNNDRPTIHFVPTEESGRHLAFDLTGCHYILKDLTRLAPTSNAKGKTESNILTAKTLSSEGLSARKIAQVMGVSNFTVSKWLKS